MLGRSAALCQGGVTVQLGPPARAGQARTQFLLMCALRKVLDCGAA